MQAGRSPNCEYPFEGFKKRRVRLQVCQPRLCGMGPLSPRQAPLQGAGSGQPGPVVTASGRPAPGGGRGVLLPGP